MPDFHGPAIEIARLNAVHDFLTGRGWTLSPYTDASDDGYPDEAEASWIYPASYGGADFNDIDVVGPLRLTCRISFPITPEGDVTITVQTAGNWQGCDEHDTVDHSIDLDDNELINLAHVLDALEPEARALDVRALIECRFFGECGQEDD